MKRRLKCEMNGRQRARGEDGKLGWDCIGRVPTRVAQVWMMMLLE